VLSLASNDSRSPSCYCSTRAAAANVGFLSRSCFESYLKLDNLRSHLHCQYRHASSLSILLLPPPRQCSIVHGEHTYLDRPHRDRGHSR